MMGCMFLLLYVYHEMNYDHFYEKTDRVFRVVTDVVAEEGGVNPGEAAIHRHVRQENQDTKACGKR